MSTAVWPRIAPHELAAEEAKSQARELSWLLVQVQQRLQSLKAGLDECAALLARREDAATTLVLTSVRSEAVKGVITRCGDGIVKGRLRLRLPSLPPPRGSATFDLSIASPFPTGPASLVLEQLSAVRRAVNNGLDAIDVAAWSGNPDEPAFVAGQLRLLAESIHDARSALRGYSDAAVGQWWERPVDEHVFDPPLPANVSFHLTVFDAALVLEIRTLVDVRPASSSAAATAAGGGGGDDAASPSASTFTGLKLRDRLATALGGATSSILRPPPPFSAPSHDEASRVFAFRGREVRVREKVRVETQDPALLASMAKLAALARCVDGWRRAVDVVGGRAMADG